MEPVTSKENNGIKLYRKLSSQRKERKESGLFTVEGLRLCCEAAHCGLGVPHLFLTPGAAERYGEELVPLKAAAEHLTVITEELSGYMGETKTPQGVFAICSTPPGSFEQPWRTDPEGRFLLLDRIQDPGNLGAIIRSADAFGITALLLTADCADCYAPKVLRGAMGSVFRLPVIYCPTLSPVVDEMRGEGLQVYAATLDDRSVPVWELPSKGVGVVIGNEGKGITPGLVRQCGQTVHIPMKGGAESLNAAVAASILLWELSGRG